MLDWCQELGWVYVHSIYLVFSVSLNCVFLSSILELWAEFECMMYLSNKEILTTHPLDRIF